MKKISLLFVLILSLMVYTSCGEHEPSFTKNTDFVTFETTSMDLPIEVGTTVMHDIIIYATQSSSSERIINVNVEGSTTADPASYVVPSAVTIPAGETHGVLTVSVSDINISGGGETLVIAFSPTNEMFTSDNVTLNISQVCDAPVMLDILFDGYASECTFQITNSTGDVLASGGPWADGTATYSNSLCLADGTYTFSVADSWGDGLSYPNDGSITIMHNGQTLVNIVGNYGTGTSAQFDISN